MKKISYKIKLIDYQDLYRKKHKKPTPVSGGSIIFLSSISSLFFILNIVNLIDIWLHFLLIYTIFFFIGLFR